MYVRSLVASLAIVLMPFSHSFAHSDHATVGTTPMGGLGGASKKSIDTPIEIHNRYGEAYYFESPSNDEEKYVNLGYASLNVFHYLDAYRAFKAAYTINNDSVDALVGLILSVNQQARSQAERKLAADYYKEIQRVKNDHGLSAKEAAWAGVVGALYFGEGNPADAVAKLQAEDGDNVEFLVSLNWILMNSRARAQADAVADFKKALQKYPNHAGANHFLLHMSEGANDIPAAQAYGKILIKSAVGSAHGQHMYGHTLPQTGKWQEALDMFLIAHKIHLDYEQKYQIPLFEDWHYAHNLDLMAATYLGLGNSAEALKLWQEAMPHDGRAIAKVIGLALAKNDFALAKKLISTQKAVSPNSVVLFEQELNFLENGTAMSQFGRDAFSQINQILLAIESGQATFAQYKDAIEGYFVQSLTSGGFDGWSHSFVELLRLRNIAQKLGVTEFVTLADDIDAKAKTGTL